MSITEQIAQAETATEMETVLGGLTATQLRKLAAEHLVPAGSGNKARVLRTVAWGLLQQRPAQVVETAERTPRILASRIVGEDARTWQVACETGCGNHVDVSKTELVPADWAQAPQRMREIRFTAPGARRCATCC